MATFRVKIASENITEGIINPIWKGEFTYKRERDRMYYTHEIKGDLVLIHNDFLLINDLENECEVVTLTVERRCNGDWSTYWQGFFTKFDTKLDLDQCKLSVSPKPDTKYTCLFRAWEEAVNFYEATPPITLKSIVGGYEVGTMCFQATFSDDPECIGNPGDVGCLEFCTFEDLGNGDTLVTTCYHAEYGDGTPTEPPEYGDGWIHVSGNQWWRCPDEDTLAIGVLGRGRDFNPVLEYIVDQTDCELTVRSHFFGINATHTAAPDNLAYDYAEANLQHLTIFQKSDVKRPDTSNPSLPFIWKIKLKDLLADLQTVFNVFWVIDGNDLILEHVSYFEAVEGEDYTGATMKLQVQYDAGVPRKESFVWSDEYCSEFFAGLPIEYDCGESAEERRVSLFSTDLAFIRKNNGEENQDKIADENWVLIAAFESGDNLGIIDYNRPLAWTNLHENLHMHYRPFTSGTLNGEPVTFLSTQKVKKQPAFKVPMCCDGEQDPKKFITTALGEGQVQQSTYNIFKDTLEIEPAY